MFKTVLLAFDGSENARRALDVALDIASRYKAKLYAVEVIDIHSMNLADLAKDSSFNVAGAIREIKAKASGHIKRCIVLAQEKGLEADGEVLDGDPASEILRYSGEIGADLIVTGSRGLSSWKRLVLGSVSNRIVSEAKVATLVIK